MKLEEQLDEADTFGLRFDSQDDALNYADKLTQDSIDWVAVRMA